MGKINEEKPEHKNQNKMDEFLKENVKDLSFKGIKDDICYQTIMTPIEFEMNGIKWQAYWHQNDKLNFQTETEKYELDEEFIHKTWDDICSKKIFVSGEDKEKDLIYFLLMKKTTTHYYCYHKMIKL